MATTGEQKRSKRRLTFTDRSVRTAKPDPKVTRTEYSDKKTQGLKLRVWRTKSGEVRRGFSVVYTTRAGKVRRYDIGSEVTLEQARKKAKEVLAQAELGSDPQAERKAKRRASANSLGELLDRWLEEEAEGWADRVARQWRKIADLWTEEVGDWPLTGDELELRDKVQAYLRRVKKTTPTTAKRRYEVLRRCLRWARETGKIRHNPIEGMKPPAGRKPRSATFSDDQLRTIDRVSGEQGWQELFRLVAYTAVRRNEAREAAWNEFDLKRRVWTIPASRTKTDEPHLVPLTDGSLRVLAEIRRRNLAEGWGSVPLLFPAHGRGDRNEVIVPRTEPKYEGVKEALGLTAFSMILHDVRRTVRSRLPSLEVRPGVRVTPDIAERVLGHALQGIRKVYDRADYLPAMREALEAWSVELDSVLGVEKKRETR